MGQSLPVEPTTLDTASYHGATFAQEMNMNSFMAQSYPGMYTYPLHSWCLSQQCLYRRTTIYRPESDYIILVQPR